MTDDIENLEERLFDARETLVGHAEDKGYGEKFPDEQSIADMKTQVESIEDDEDREFLLKLFEEVEQLYNEYTAALTADVSSEF